MDETVIKRVMPHNGEAEEAVIGSMLLDQDAVVLASEKLMKMIFTIIDTAFCFPLLWNCFMKDGRQT